MHDIGKIAVTLRKMSNVKMYYQVTKCFSQVTAPLSVTRYLVLGDITVRDAFFGEFSLLSP